ncbi:ATP-binding protein [Thalassotalea psychrophila]|uniref:histidine kinase n=1 Tax=Thalassotalea psychrophila TaxID=3065647 RepID=A0ABY9TUP9_9GAMM|nr:ATP-binding protein [Colwelliaceae bacterium SQ149]
MSKIFSSLTLKVFLGFWIIALAAMFITRWISIQFIEFDRVSAITPLQQQQIEKVSKRIESIAKKNKTNITKLIADKDRRLPKDVWLKSITNNKIFNNSRFSRPDVNLAIEQQKFTQAVVTNLRGYELIGPIPVIINQNQFNLFIGKLNRPKDIAGFLHGMPIWLRVFTVLLVTGGLIWLLSWYLIRPLKQLTQASHRFGAGDLSVRLPEFNQREDEIGRLGQAFNGMAEHLESSIGAQQRLLGDVSHELRSPLTRLQLALSLASKVDNKPEELTKYFDRFKIEINRLDEMIAQALQLSRIENQLQQINLQQLCLTDLLEQLIIDVDLPLKQKQLSIKFNCKQRYNIVADATQLASAIENIINNAIRYSPENSVIEILLTTENNNVILTISDQGRGVPSNQLEQIFTPFYRTAQARDRVSGGTGLGLAIASKAILAHHGKIFAQTASSNKEFPGLKVTIELPYPSN